MPKTHLPDIGDTWLPYSISTGGAYIAPFAICAADSNSHKPRWWPSGSQSWFVTLRLFDGS